MAETFGTPRRTKLLKSAQLAPLKGTALPEAVGNGKQAKLTLEISDSACWVLLSATGQIARTADRTEVDFNSARIKHDVLVSQVPSSARGEIGALTSTGRIIRVSLIDVPALPESHGFPQLAQGVPVTEFLKLAKSETAIALVPLNEVIAIGTQQGVVKRVTPEYPLNRDEFEAITLKDGDAVVAAAVAREEDELVFLTRDAQLLRFSASAVRPQGRTGRGMAGIKLSENDRVIFFGVVPANAEHTVVATIAAGSQTLPGTSGQSVKLTEFAEFPSKGRATAGVRAHRFVKGEDHLRLGFAGQGPARASSTAGIVRALPTEYAKRDGSGAPLAQSINILGGTLSVNGAQPAPVVQDEPDSPVEVRRPRLLQLSPRAKTLCLLTTAESFSSPETNALKVP